MRLRSFSWRHTVWLAALLTPPVTIAGADQDLAALFQYRATIEAEGDGLCRLVLPEEVLRNCRADLADLRVVDAEGNELPFAVDGRPPVPTVEVRSLRPDLVHVDRRRERVAETQYRWLESYHLRLPPGVTEAPGWELVIATSRAEVVASVDVRLRPVQGTEQPLVQDVSVFRLVTPEVERLRVPLGVLQVGTLEVDLITNRGGFVEPMLALESVRSPLQPRPAAIPLELVDVVHTGSHTTATVRRPRGVVPDRLAISTSTDTFHRQVDVWDAGPGARDERLGSAQLFRIATEQPVAETRITIEPPSGDQLQLVVVDLDSPPLADLKVIALVRQPALLVPLPEGTRRGTLLFGGGRARAPSYDIATLLPRPGEQLSGAAAERARATWDPSRSNTATVVTIRENPAWNPEPTLAFTMRPGRELNPAAYSHRRHLEVTPSREGLARLRLEPEDLAVARPDLADLRIIDGSRQQWAYLLESGRSSTALELEILWEDAGGGRSRATLRPPVPVARIDRLQLHTDLAFFDRPYTLTARTDTDTATEVTLASGRLHRFQTPSRPIEIRFDPIRVTELSLEITDGNDAPLPVASATARAPLVDVYLPARPGSLTVLLGNPNAAAPSYELERIRSVVLAVPAQAIEAGPLSANPSHGTIRQLIAAVPTGTLAVWAVLVVAVAVLAWLTVRLARQREAE